MKNHVVFIAAALLFASGIVFGNPTPEQLLKLTGIERGLFVHLDCDKPALVSGIAGTGRFLAHALCADEATAKAARKELMSSGLSGLTCVEALALDKLPYTKNMVDLLAAGDFAKLKAKGVTLDEIVRVLAPRGVACLGVYGDKAQLEKELKRLAIKDIKFVDSMVIFTKPRPAGMDDWSHAKHGPDGNAVSKDLTLGVPNHLQWVAGPTRSYHRFSFGPIASGPGRMLSAGGRNFYQQGGNIVARNAFNGVLLWVRPISTKIARMVASDTMLYTCPENTIFAYDAATGEKVRTFSEHTRCSMLLLVDNTLLAAGGDGVKAFDIATGKLKWASGKGVSSALIDQGRVFYGSFTGVTALRLKDGKELWSKDLSQDAGKKARLQFASAGMLFFTQATGTGTEAIAFKGTDGSLAWKATSNTKGMVFYADGLLWMEHASKEHAEGEPAITRESEKLSKWVGHNSATGKVERTHAGPVTLKYACHTLYPSDRFMIANRPIYFMDWDTGKAYSFEGTRIQCGIAYFLGQGMFYGLYTTPKKCMCMATVMAGITAFASIGDVPNIGEVAIQTEGRFVKGKAEAPSGSGSDFKYDWPMYRSDHTRSSSVGVSVPNTLSVAWRRKLVETKNLESVINHDWPVSRPVGDRDHRAYSIQ